jgi:hypothetical protein
LGYCSAEIAKDLAVGQDLTADDANIGWEAGFGVLVQLMLAETRLFGDGQKTAWRFDPAWDGGPFTV